MLLVLLPELLLFPELLELGWDCDSCELCWLFSVVLGGLARATPVTLSAPINAANKDITFKLNFLSFFTILILLSKIFLFAANDGNATPFDASNCETFNINIKYFLISTCSITNLSVDISMSSLSLLVKKFIVGLNQ